jgi:hypothetical protein
MVRVIANVSRHEMVRAIVMAGVLNALVGSAAFAGECTKSQAQAAYQLAPEIRTWDGLYQAFRKYAHCDDGAISGGFSESTSIILSDNWGTLKRGATLMKQNPNFKAFVFRHLGEETPRDRWTRIVENASKDCPDSLLPICKELTTRQAK